MNNQAAGISRLSSRRWQPAVLAVLATATLIGCRQDMHDQAKIEPYEASDFFADGVGSRVPPTHTISRGALQADEAFHTGYEADGTIVAELPMELTPELLERGEQRYNIFCSPCHARTGAGNGMIVERGFAQPPSYHEQRLREMQIGYFFDVASNGYGLMSGYKAQIKPEDRWAIAAWIRVLQFSRNAPVEALSADERQRIAAAANGEAASGDHASDNDHSAESHDEGHDSSAAAHEAEAL